MFKKLFNFFWDKSLLTFLIIGGSNSVITIVGSQLLLTSLGYWGSTALMFTVCSVASFVLNRKFSFKSSAPLAQSAVRFAIVIAACYFISFGLSDYLVPWVSQMLIPSIESIWITRASMLVAQVIFTALNYIGQRLWAFKE